MLKSLHTAASGMSAQQFKIDVLSNNLANVNTAGFKRSRADFEDLLYQIVRTPGVKTGNNSPATGLDVGSGVRVAGTERIMQAGDLQQTQNPLDIAIEGDGFLQVRQADGSLAYTRTGTLRTDADGQIVTPAGEPLDPPIVIPQDAVQVTIAPDGQVSVLVGGRTEPLQIGRMELSRFVNPASLRPLGHNLFASTTASGDAMVTTPGIDGTGTLLQGFVETSNVKVVEEMVDLIASQRAYELNSKAIQAADSILQRLVNMR